MIRTIIVDDEILSRIGIQSFLEGEEDIKVLGIFAGAKEALDYLRNNTVDIVITDIEMSEMDGLDFITHIRREELAEGIIIMSCHDDFRYAQEAIARGTNSYMLKTDVTKENVIAEIKNVYSKTKKSDKLIPQRVLNRSVEIMEDGIYIICVLQLRSEDEESNEHLEGTMLVHLLEDVVARYSLGTFFAPVNKEMFIIFRFEHSLSVENRECKMANNLSIIKSNASQYVTGEILYGISSMFTDMKEIKSKYSEAITALNLVFYESNVCIYEWDKVNNVAPQILFSTLNFMGEDGIDIYRRELEMTLNQARRTWTSVEILKEQLIHGMNTMMYQILRDNGVSKAFDDKWKGNSMLVSLVMKATKIKKLEDDLIKMLIEFRNEIKSDLKFDELSEIFRYIELHLEEKILLSDLAEVGCMSVASLCKKFKDREGKTPVQYINEKRIEKAQILMKNRNNSLWEIAEKTGFSNVNYLIRVFKKTKGITVGDYRKQYGILENNETNIK